jgi:hypothetical protein
VLEERGLAIENDVSDALNDRVLFALSLEECGEHPCMV